MRETIHPKNLIDDSQTYKKNAGTQATQGKEEQKKRTKLAIRKQSSRAINITIIL